MKMSIEQVTCRFEGNSKVPAYCNTSVIRYVENCFDIQELSRTLVRRSDLVSNLNHANKCAL